MIHVHGRQLRSLCGNNMSRGLRWQSSMTGFQPETEHYEYHRVKEKIWSFYSAESGNAKKELPGEDAQFRMLPTAAGKGHRLRASEVRLNSEKTYRESAVMILCYPLETGQLGFCLTKRRRYKGAHSAQVCLPGGSVDEMDQSLRETAERECFEEVGVTDIGVVGELSSIYIPVSNFLVSPFIGFATQDQFPKFQPHPREVETVIHTSMKSLLDDQFVKTTTMEFKDRTGTASSYETPYFDIQGEVVWGATAAILSEFKEFLKKIK